MFRIYCGQSEKCVETTKPEFDYFVNAKLAKHLKAKPMVASLQLNQIKLSLMIINLIDEIVVRN